MTENQCFRLRILVILSCESYAYSKIESERYYSVFVSDNAAIHHSQEVVDAIHATGAIVVLMPSYSPGFMPCEELFAQAKNWIRENDAAWQFCDDPGLMVEEAFLQTTDQEVIYNTRNTCN